LFYVILFCFILFYFILPTFGEGHHHPAPAVQPAQPISQSAAATWHHRPQSASPNLACTAAPAMMMMTISPFG
jgi:hypothetical protein